MKPQRTKKLDKVRRRDHIFRVLYVYSTLFCVKKYTLYFCLLFLFIPIKTVFGLSPSSDHSLVSDYPRYLFRGFKYSLTDKTNQWILGAASLSALLFHSYDKRIQTYAVENGLMSESLSQFLDHYGGRYAYPLGLVVVGFTSYLDGGRNKFIRDMKYYMTVMGVTAFVTDFLKQTVGRERPNKRGKRSFPSGHTSGSFAFASVMDELYGLRIGVPAYGIAGLVGVQRIHDNKHWLSDVIIGAMLGTIVGRGFGKVHQKEGNNGKVSIQTRTNENHVQLVVVVSIH